MSKGISAGHGQNTYRGLVKILGKADAARNYSQCDSLLIGDKCGAHTFPYIEVDNSTAQMEHEASTSKIGEDQIFYFQQRGISAEDAVNMIVNGFCKAVFKELRWSSRSRRRSCSACASKGSVRVNDRQRSNRCSKSRTSTPRVGGKRDPQRASTSPSTPGEVHAIMGPNGSGK